MKKDMEKKKSKLDALEMPMDESMEMDELSLDDEEMDMEEEPMEDVDAMIAKLEEMGYMVSPPEEEMEDDEDMMMDEEEDEEDMMA